MERYFGAASLTTFLIGEARIRLVECILIPLTDLTTVPRKRLLLRTNLIIVNCGLSLVKPLENLWAKASVTGYGLSAEILHVTLLAV